MRSGTWMRTLLGSEVYMREARERRRELFLARMSKEAMAAYEHPYREWDDDEKELLPLFLSLVGSGKRIP